MAQTAAEERKVRRISKHRMLPMGDVVRPSFGLRQREIQKILVPGDGEPRKIYGAVGCYRVALHCDDYPGTYPMLKLRLARSDTEITYLLATLPMTQEGHFEAHAIASAVLETLRVIGLTGAKP